MRPRYFRARKSHCWYTNDWHLYAFPWQPAHHGAKNVGVTIKQRRTDGRWRHYTIRLTAKKDTSFMIAAEAVTHLSEKCAAERVHFSKKYIRFKLRL